jgi:hypothetical protein
MRSGKIASLLFTFVTATAVFVLGNGFPGGALQAKQEKAKKGGKAKAEKSAPAVVDVDDLTKASMEVAALQALRSFDFTQPQLREIAGMASKSVADARSREAGKATPKFINTLRDLREALVKNDRAHIETLQESLDKIRDTNPPDLDEDVEVSDGARQEVPRLLDMLSPRQVAAYLGNLADDFPDPVELLVKGLEEDKDLKGEDWQAARDDLAAESAALVAGLHPQKLKKLRTAVSEFLDGAHEKKRASSPELEAEIRKILGKVNPIALIKNRVETDLGELLSNPQLAPAVKACLGPEKK